MATERKVFEIDVQTGESGKRVKDVDQKLTELRAELTKAQAALKDFKASNKDDKSLIEQSATYQQLEGNLKKVRSEYGRLQNEQQGIRSNTTGLTNALKEAAREIAAGLSAELKKANANLEAFVQTQKETTGTVDKQSSEYKALEVEVQRLSKDYEILQAQQKAVDQTTNQFTNTLNSAAVDLKAGLTLELEKAQTALREFMEANKNVGPIVKQTVEYQKLEHELERLNTEYLKLDKQQSTLKSTSKDITSAIGSVALKVTAGIAAFQGITSVISSSVEAYGQSEAAQKQLEVALGFTSKAILEQATALASKTKFDDDAVVASAALLAQQQLSEEQIQALLPAILDLSEAQGVDLATATEAVAVSIVNGSDKLKKYGIDLDGAAGSNERAADAVAKLTDRFGSQAEEAAKIGTGPLKVFSNELGNLQEALGGLVVSAINPFLSSLTDMAQGLTELLTPAQSVSEAFDDQLSAFVDTQVQLDELIPQYDDLSGKQNLTAEEQTQLNSVIQQIGVLMPDVVTAFDSYGNALDINKEKLKQNREEQKAFLAVTNKKAIDETRESLTALEKERNGVLARINGTAANFVKVNGQLFKDIFDAGSKTTIRVPVEPAEIAGFRDRLVELKTEITGTQVLLDKLTGADADKEVEARKTKTQQDSQATAAAANKEAEAINAATVAFKNQTATLEQLDLLKTSLTAEQKTVGPGSRAEEIRTDLALIDQQVTAIKGLTKTRSESSKTDQQTFTESITALQQESQKELAVIKTQEDNKTITSEVAETRRLAIMRDAAQKRLDLTTEFASKGGFTVEEIADLASLQQNADDAAKVYDDFLAKLEQNKAKAENAVAFQFDQINLSTQLEQDLAAFDAFSAAKAKEEKELGLSHDKRIANQKERDAERLKILQTGNAAVLQSQLDFINAQVEILQRVQASGVPLTDVQKQQLDALLAQARELKTAILQATAAPTDTPDQTSFFDGLFNLTDAQKKNLMDRAIGFAQEVGQALVSIARQNNEQQLQDTTNRVNSEYSVAVDSLRSQQEAGQLTAAEFEERRKSLEAKKNAQILQAKQKAFKANQNAALAEVALNTAVAVTSALRGGITPVDKAIAVAFALAQGALQAVVIKQQQPPQFGQGGQLPGRVLTGRSHEAGGVPIYGEGGTMPFAIAEGGEFMASKAATDKFLPVFQALNDNASQRPPVPKVAAFQQTSESRSALNKNTEPQMMRAYVLESDITQSQQRISRINSKAEIGE